MKVKTMSKFTFIESGLRMRFSYNFNTFNPSNTAPFAHPNAVTYLSFLVLAPPLECHHKFSLMADKWGQPGGSPEIRSRYIG